MDWTDRAEAQRKTLGITKKEVAQALGVGPSTYSAAIGERRRNPSSFSLDNLAEILQVPPLWLKEGVSKRDEEVFLPPDMASVKIPIMDVYASAGSGRNPMNSKVIDQMFFAESFARRLSRSGGIENLSIIYAYGDSMDPLICDGDSILVDTGMTRFYTDGIFVLTFEEHLFVKRVHYNPVRKTLSLRSDNPLHENIENVPVESVRLQGEVLWVARPLVRLR